MGVREDNRIQTRRALADAAMALFFEHGYADVTMADIAGAAGVSRRTAFRYFPSKDDLVMEYPNDWMTVFNDFVATNAELGIFERLRLAAHAVIHHIEDDSEAIKQAFLLAFSHPSLAAKYAASSQVWIERVASEIEPSAEANRSDLVRARIIASAYMGMINVVCEIWAETGEPMTPMVDESFAMILDVT